MNEICEYIYTKRKILAFTLAEVLIVLGIIGTIAEMTIPTLLSNVESQKYRSSFKKTYSSFTQAYISFKQDGGTSIDELYNYLKVEKTCDTADTTDCWGANYRCADNSSTTLVFIPTGKGAGSSLGTISLTRPSDGVSVKILDYGVAGTGVGVTCGSTAYSNYAGSIEMPRYVYVFDLNGAQMPNKIGTDVFAVYSANGIFKPLGTGCDVSGIGCGYDVLMNADY